MNNQITHIENIDRSC